MKAIVLLSLVAALASAQPVKLVWDSNTETNVAGYKLLWGPTTGTYNRTNAIAGRTNNTVTVTNGTPGKVFFAMMAIADDGTESELSNEVVWTNRIFAPKNLKVSAVVQASQSVTGPWTNLASIDVILPPVVEAGFFRSRLMLEELK